MVLLCLPRLRHLAIAHSQIQMTLKAFGVLAHWASLHHLGFFVLESAFPQAWPYYPRSLPSPQYTSNSNTTMTTTRTATRGAAAVLQLLPSCCCHPIRLEVPATSIMAGLVLLAVLLVLVGWSAQMEHATALRIYSRLLALSSSRPVFRHAHGNLCQVWP